MAKLTIRFTGLCLFVPDAATGTMHVFIPETSGCCAPHGARLDYKPQHVPGHLEQGKCPLDGGRFSLFEDENAADLAVPAQVADVTAELGRRVPRRFLDGTDVTGVRAHLVLGRGRFVHAGTPRCFSLNPQRPPIPMTHFVEWEIPGVPAHFLLTRKGLGSPTGPSNDRGIDMKGKDVELHVRHVVALPTASTIVRPATIFEPPDGSHFRAFYRLLDNPTPVLPKFVADDCPPIAGAAPALANGTAASPGEAPAEDDGNESSSSYTCMNAQAKPE